MSVHVRRLVTSPLLTDFIFRNTTTAKHMKTAEALHNTHNASTTTKKNWPTYTTRGPFLLPLQMLTGQARWVQPPSQPSAPYVSANVLHEHEREQKTGAQT